LKTVFSGLLMLSVVEDYKYFLLIIDKVKLGMVTGFLHDRLGMRKLGFRRPLYTKLHKGHGPNSARLNLLTS
jgi:hypothetical protein